MTVQENGTYRFDSKSAIITYGYLYEHKFNAFNPTENLLAQSNYSCNGFHFQFTTYLQMTKIYVLVVTTFEPRVEGAFSVFVYGPKNVSLHRTCEYFKYDVNATSDVPAYFLQDIFVESMR